MLAALSMTLSVKEPEIYEDLKNLAKAKGVDLNFILKSMVLAELAALIANDRDRIKQILAEALKK